MMIAFAVSASETSLSLIAPTPPWMISMLTSSLPNLPRDCLTASRDPWTSALMMSLTVLSSPFEILSKRSSRLTAPLESSFLVASLSFLSAERSLAKRSLSTTSIMSPASGSSSQPVTETGVEGPAFLTCLPLSSIITLTLPVAVPAIISSPHESVPD